MSAAILQALCGSTTSLAILLFGRGGLRRLCGPRMAYACWLMPLLGAVAPILPAAAIPDVLGAPARAVSRVVSPSVLALARTFGLGMVDVRPLCLVWILAASLFLGWQLLAYHNFMLDAHRNAVVLPRESGITVLRSPGLAIPVAAGLLRRRVFVPEDFERRFTPPEREMVLRHEQAHHDRHDLPANLLALLLLALHWWNPLAYRAYRRFRADQELACDATATRGLDGAARLAYGTAILKCVAAPRPVLACAMSGKLELRTRLAALADCRDTPRRDMVRTASAAVVLVLGALLSTAATFGLAAPDDGPVLASARSRIPPPLASAVLQAETRGTPHPAFWSDPLAKVGLPAGGAVRTWISHAVLITPLQIPAITPVRFDL
ncbi:MAG: M56 family metallopeptidase [Janthinobacterium lividum]